METAKIICSYSYLESFIESFNKHNKIRIIRTDESDLKGKNEFIRVYTVRVIIDNKFVIAGQRSYAKYGKKEKMNAIRVVHETIIKKIMKEGINHLKMYAELSTLTISNESRILRS